MNASDLEELITTTEAAQILGIKPISFSLWLNGHIPSKGPFELKPALKLGGAYLWNRKEVEEFADKLVGKGRYKYNPTPFPEDE